MTAGPGVARLLRVFLATILSASAMALISDYFSYHHNHIAPNQFAKKFPTKLSIYLLSRRFQTKNPSIVKETLSRKELYSIVFIVPNQLNQLKVAHHLV